MNGNAAILARKPQAQAFAVRSAPSSAVLRSTAVMISGPLRSALFWSVRLAVRFWLTGAPFPPSSCRTPGCSDGARPWRFHDSLRSFCQIDHIHQLHACLKNGMVIIVRKEVFDAMMLFETAFLIERNRQRAVARSDQQAGTPIPIMLRHEIQQRPSVSLSTNSLDLTPNILAEFDQKILSMST